MTQVKYSECGVERDDPLDQREVKPCPKCGSRKRKILLFIKDEVVLHEKLRMKNKETRLTGKRKTRQEIIQGHEIYRQTGKWIDKERVIDKDVDRYREKIVDLETGATIHLCDEPLSKHKGHGSAKKNQGDR